MPLDQAILPSFLQGAIEKIPTGVLALDLNLNIVYWNPAMQRIANLDGIEVLEKPVLTLLSALFERRTSKELVDQLLSMVDSPQDLFLDIQLEDPESPTRYFILQASPLLSPAGDIAGIQVLWEDTGEPCRSIEIGCLDKGEHNHLDLCLHEDDGLLATIAKRVGELAEQVNVQPKKCSEEEEERLSSALNESVKELMVIHRVARILQEKENGIPEILQEIVDVLPGGWQRTEAVSTRISYENFVFTSAGFSPSARVMSAEIYVGGQGPGRIEVFNHDGDTHVETGFLKEEQTLLDSVADMLGAFLERRRFEDALRMSEERVRTLYENAPIGIYRTSPSGQVLMANSTLVRMLGYRSLEELAENNLEEVSVQSGYPRQFMKERIEKAGEVHGLDVTWRRPDNTLLHLRENAKVTRADDGTVLYYEGTLEDITERKLAEERVLRLAAKLKAIARTTRQISSLLDPEELIQQFVPALQEITDCFYASLFLMDGDNLVMVGAKADDDIDRLPLGYRLDLGKGIIGLAAASGKPVLAQDVNLRPEYLFCAELPETRAELSVPVITAGKFLGVIDIQSKEPGSLDETDLEAMSALADQLAVALENARLFEETKRRGEEFAVLYATTNDLAKQLDLPALLETTLEHAAALLNVRCGGIYLYDPTREDLELVVGKGTPIPIGTRILLGEGMAGHVAQTRQPFILDDYQTWEQKLPQFDDIPFSASVKVPMLYGGDLIGILSIAEVGPTARKFSEADVRLLTLLASQAASAVHNARLFEEIRQRAEQLELLYQAGLVLNSMLDHQTLLENLFKTAIQALHVSRAEFYRYDAENEELYLQLSLGYNEKTRGKISGLRFPFGEERGLTGWVAKNRQPLNLADVSADERYIAIDPSIRSGLLVPVLHENQLMGVLNVFSSDLNAFKEQDERLLTLFANQAAVAMENARLFEETERHLKQVQALRTIDQAISASLDLRVTLNIFLEQVVSQLSVPAADILLFNSYTHSLQFSAGRGFRSMIPHNAQQKIGEGLAGKAALERRIVHIHNLEEKWDGARGSLLLPKEDFKTYFAVPLIAKGQVKGVLEIFYRTVYSPLPDWLDFLETLAGQAAIAIDNAELFDRLQQSNIELSLAYEATIEGWSRALDLRDKETEGHTKRVTEITMQLARVLGMSEANLTHIQRGALLHDIGKMGIPDSILHKPGPLSEEEWRIMRKHPVYAYELISAIPFLRPAIDIPYCHHEKWNGTGYPRGLAGDQIPLAARIFAVVDVWDALRSNRPYRSAWKKEKVLDYLQEQAGLHFDPRVVKAFLDLGIT